ncbi:MAG: DUF58 domain-containing protein [Verrucomicrobiae bacterium]|nr:DUF58 domain-containing protein [Verrucomicrobiae bacterium]
MQDERIKAILKKVRQIEIQTSRLVDDNLSGRYASVFKGRGMDFDRVRNYVNGDETRTIDWNVTARTGAPHVKTFTEERELTILLMVDLSASSDFGSSPESKRELAAEVASVLAFSAIRNQDKVGLLLFTGEVELYVPPGKGKSHILRIVREILFFEPQGRTTSLTTALDFASKVLHRRAVTFLISDFCINGDFDQELTKFQRKLQTTGKRHDVIAVTVNDAREFEMPDIGWLTVEDAETGELVEINTRSEKVRDGYRQRALQRRMAVRRTIRSCGVDLLELTAGEPWMPGLMAFLKSRTRNRVA